MRIFNGVSELTAATVPAGARLRATSRLTTVKPLDGAVQAELSTTIEIEHGAKPACVAESVLRYIA
jgi:acyl dehydratase